MPVGRGGDHLPVEMIGIEGFGAGNAEHMLGQHVERAGTHGRGVLGAEIIAVERGLAFHHLEAVGRHQDRPGRLVHPVVRTADPLGEPACALRRADMDDEIDLAPVKPEIEGRGGDHGAQPFSAIAASTRRLCRHRASVVERDRQVVVIDRPELLEKQFRLGAGVDEEDRHPVRLDGL